MLFVHHICEVFRVGFRQPSLFIQHVQQSYGLVLEQIDTVLVVRIFYPRYVQAFLGI